VLSLGKLVGLLGATGQGLPSDMPLATAYVGPGPWGSLGPEIPSYPSQLYEAILVAASIGVLVLLSRFEAGFKRAGLDYLELADVVRHGSWEAFRSAAKGRLVLLTTKGALSYTAFAYAANDILLLGRESAGVPDYVHQAAESRLCIPMRTGLRSINVAQAGAMVLGEALRQTHQFPET